MKPIQIDVAVRDAREEKGSPAEVSVSARSKMAGRLVIKAKPGMERLPRHTTHSLNVTLDGKELPPWFKLNLTIDTKGVVAAEIGFYPSEIDVEAQVLADFGIDISKE